MPFYSKWFRKKLVSNVEIEDRNKKQEEGLRKLFEIFKEVTGNHEKAIDDFLNVYELPEADVLEFLKKYKLTLVNNEAPVSRFERAKHYASLRKKYGFIFTSAAYQKFCRLMSDDYDVYLEFKAPESLNLSLEIVEMFMKAASDIELADTELYGMFRGYNGYSYQNHFQRNVLGPGLLEDMVKERQPDDLKYAEPFELEWTKEEREKLTKEYNYNSRSDLPSRFMYGEFQAIQVGTDPIIIASLNESIYKLLGHVSRLPARDSFEI